MVMLNDLDRFHLVIDVVDRVPGLSAERAHLRQDMVDARLRHRAYTREHGEDRPDVSRLDLAVLIAGPHPRRQCRLDKPQALAGRRSGGVEPVDVARPRRRATSWRSAHRFVHGGAALPRAGADRRRRRTASCASSAELAPLHSAPALAAIDAARRAAPACRRSPSSTRPSTRRCPTRPPPTRCPRAGAPTGDPPLRLPRALGAVGIRAGPRSRGSSSATSAAAAR